MKGLKECDQKQSDTGVIFIANKENLQIRCFKKSCSTQNRENKQREIVLIWQGTERAGTA